MIRFWWGKTPATCGREPKTDKKNMRFQKYPDTCGRGIFLAFTCVYALSPWELSSVSTAHLFDHRTQQRYDKYPHNVNNINDRSKHGDDTSMLKPTCWINWKLSNGMGTARIYSKTEYGILFLTVFLGNTHRRHIPRALKLSPSPGHRNLECWVKKHEKNPRGEFRSKSTNLYNMSFAYLEQ